MTESAAEAGEGAGLEQPAIQEKQTRTTDALEGTGPDNTGISPGGNLWEGSPYPNGRILHPGNAMIAPLLASLLLVVQNRPALDSATVTRVLTQLKASDSAVCVLAGEALTNYGGFWGHAPADPGMPMPQPMPTPMPMPGGGGGRGVHPDMHERSRDVAAA